MNSSALTERPNHAFDLGGEVVNVRVRESNRARMTRVIVGPRRPLEIIVPRGTGVAQIDSFLASKRDWIAAKVAASRAIAERPAQLGLERPGVVWLEGKPVQVEVLVTPAPPWLVRTTARLRDDKLVVDAIADTDPERKKHAAKAVERWYRREARRQIVSVVERESARLGVEHNVVGIRDPRTRWGSCSRRRNLSFSWRLILAPSEVLEYVVVHELLHLREPNHTKSFWRLVEVARPGWQEQTRWLREHGQELHDYSPASAV